eukprot:12928476-Prorocentrum_lima.AAC.1
MRTAAAESDAVSGSVGTRAGSGKRRGRAAMRPFRLGEAAAGLKAGDVEAETDATEATPHR